MSEIEPGSAGGEEPNAFNLIKAKILEGRNVFISGVGGCGKSYLIKQLYEDLSKEKICVLSSTTGISAYNLNGITIHSWCKIIIPTLIPKSIQDWADKLVVKLRRRRGLQKKYRTVDIIFIDEVSMLGSNYVDVFNYVCQQLRNNDLPFGGIQLVLGGDMMQLAPVRDDYPFKSVSWEELDLVNFRLTKAWRFDNQRWIDLLHRARLGKLNEEDKKLLKSRVNANKEGFIPPIFLASKNDIVDDINQSKLDEIKEPSIIFRASDYVVTQTNDHDDILDMERVVLTPDISKGFLADEQVELKVGCQVMLIANLDVVIGLTNGTRGIVRSFGENKTVLVEFEHGKHEISPYNFRSEYEDKKYVRSAIPLKLAFATSIHKSQSLTLASVEIDIGEDVFCDGQSYVALSRCKSLDGLFIRSLDLSKIKPHRKALEFEMNFLKNCIDC